MPLSHGRTSKRILVLTSTFPRWKSDTEPGFVYQLSKCYISHGLAVDVLAPHAPRACPYEIMDKINIHRYRYFFERLETLAYGGGIPANLNKNPLNYLLVPFFLFFQSLAFVRLMRRNSYDLVHVHWILPQALICNLVMKLRLFKPVPVICTSHGADLYSFNSPILKTIKKWTIDKCTRVCVVSKAMQTESLAMGLTTTPPDVMPMGVDLAGCFKVDMRENRNPRRIIFVGRFVEKKGLDVLLAAYKKVADEMADTELLLVGDGPLHSDISRSVGELGLQSRVTLHGSEENHRLPALYSSAGIAVVPSVVARSGDREGLGLVTIEAMGCACAVVASRSGPLCETIADGKTGLLFEPGDDADLAEKLIALLNDPGRTASLGEAGRDSVQRYDWQHAAERYTRLIDSLV